jgi:HPt (histidine-containing phosphotransfer) domain-containing protein
MWQREPFDLVMLDEQMPGMTGTEVLRAIRAGEQPSGRLPVIALTGYNTDTDRERLLRSGFDAVLGKPVRFNVLEATLRAVAARQAAPQSGAVPAESSSVASPDPLARMGGDELLLRQVAQALLRGLPRRLTAIENAIRKKHGESLASEAHALKGSVAIFGADRATALCNQLQDSGQAGHFGDALLAFAALKEAIADLELNLRGYAGQHRATGSGAPHAKTNRRLPDSKRKKP